MWSATTLGMEIEEAFYLPDSGSPYDGPRRGGGVSL